MKKFRYSMESILKIKLKLEDQARISYAAARARLTREEEKLAVLEQRMAAYEEACRKLSSEKLDLVKLKHAGQAIEIMKQKIMQQITVVKAAEQRLEVARIRLKDAMAERKTQERLKQKAWEEYMQEYEACERKEIDELNSFHFSNSMLYEEDR